MRFDSLKQWLDWQLQLHDKAIDLGLDRVGAVAQRLGIGKIAGKVITVAGTNGKGSTVAAYESWLRSAGFSVASYTSPHLLDYNERIKLNLESVSDSELCEAFAAIDLARQETALTYFEFGTLAALFLIKQWQPDYAILEVGLGGRLDAVNLIDADLVHLTPVDIDHQAWLGDNREKIGFEKAGVLRPHIPVIVADPDPTRSVRSEIDRHGCDSLYYGVDFEAVDRQDGEFTWRCGQLEYRISAALTGEHQIQNTAAVVAGLSKLLPLSEYTASEIRQFFMGTRLRGRFERIGSCGEFQLYLDVGHNHHAALALASSLSKLRGTNGRVVVLLGMLEDKQPDLFVEALQAVVDDWWLLTLNADRGLNSQQLQARIASQVTAEHYFETAPEALEHALSSLHNEDIMLVTGSFVTVEQLLRALPNSGES